MTSKGIFWKIWYHIQKYYDYEQSQDELKLDFGLLLILNVKDIYEYQISILTSDGKFYCDDIKVLLQDNDKALKYWNELESVGMYKEYFLSKE